MLLKSQDEFWKALLLVCQNVEWDAKYEWMDAIRKSPAISFVRECLENSYEVDRCPELDP